MSDDHHEIKHDQTRIHSKAIGWSVFLTGAGVAATFIWGIIYFQGQMSQEYALKQISDPARPLVELRQYELTELGRLRWIDKDAGRVQIPIDAAIDRVVRRYSKG